MSKYTKAQRQEDMVRLLKRARLHLAHRAKDINTFDHRGRSRRRGLCAAICDAAGYIDADMDEAYHALQDLISKRLGGNCGYLEPWLEVRGYGDGHPSDKVQQTRHAWLDSLIKELSRPSPTTKEPK